MKLKWQERKGLSDYLIVSIPESLSYTIRFFLVVLHEPVTPRTAFLDHVFFLFLLVPTMGSRTLSRAFRGPTIWISRSFQGSTASCVAASKCWGREGFWRQEFVVFNPKRGKIHNATNLLTFFFADRFGLISLVAVGDWIFCWSVNPANLICFTFVLIFNVTVMTLYQKH